MERKKELKAQYKLMKPPMGVFIIRSKIRNQCVVEATKDLKGTINGSKFKLEGGSYPNRELQQAWKDKGEDNFIIEILEYLEYDEDGVKTTYREELELLRMIWIEKIEKENYTLYKR